MDFWHVHLEKKRIKQSTRNKILFEFYVCDPKFRILYIIRPWNLKHVEQVKGYIKKKNFQISIKYKFKSLRTY